MITFQKQPEPKHRPIVQEGAWLFAFGAVHVLRRRASLHIFRPQIGFNVVGFVSPMKKKELEANMFDSHFRILHLLAIVWEWRIYNSLFCGKPFSQRLMKFYRIALITSMSVKSLDTLVVNSISFRSNSFSSLSNMLLWNVVQLRATQLLYEHVL